MAKVGGRAWTVTLATTLTIAMAVGTFAQFALGVLGPLIADALALSRTALGTLTTALFLVCVACTPVIGILTDRWGARRSLALLFAAGAVGLAVIGLAPSYAWLLVGSAAAGLAVAIANPATNRLLAVHVPEGRRGPILGVKQSGVSAGALLAGVLLPVSAVAVGWRLTLVLAAVVPLLALVATRWLIPPDAPVAAGAPYVAPTLRGALGWLAACAFCVGAGLAPVGAYLPLYAHEQLGFSVFAAGLAGGTVGGAGVVGRLLWGWISERRLSPGRALVLLGAGSTAAALVVVASLASPGLVWPAAALLGLTGGSWMVVGMLAALRMGGLAGVGRSTATVALAFHAGFVPSPTVFGRIVDTLGSYPAAWSMVVAAFLCATLLAVRAGARATTAVAP